MKKQNKKEAWEWEEEFAFKGDHPEKCETMLDHQIGWCGDCYACVNCGLKFIPITLLSQERKRHEKDLLFQKKLLNIEIKERLVQERNKIFTDEGMNSACEYWYKKGKEEKRKKVVNQIIDEMANHSDWYCPKCYYEIKELLMKFLRD